MRKAIAIELDDAQREKLVKLAQSNTAEVRLARRAGIVLLAADGFDNEDIGEMLGVGRVQVGRWRARYAAGGFEAIKQDLPRGGRKPKVDPAEIVRLTTQTQPEAATQWSTRTLAAVGLGVGLGVGVGAAAAGVTAGDACDAAVCQVPRVARAVKV